MQREDFLSIWISLKTYQLRGIPTTLETKINHKINIHTNIFQKNHKKEFGPRLTEKRNSIGPQRVNLMVMAKFDSDSEGDNYHSLRFHRINI